MRIPGPSASPADSYWRELERDSAGYAACTLHVDEPALAGELSEREAEQLGHSYRRLRTVLPNTRLILTAGRAAFSRESMPVAVRLPVDALFLNLPVRPHLMIEALALAPGGLELLAPEGSA